VVTDVLAGAARESWGTLGAVRGPMVVVGPGAGGRVELGDRTRADGVPTAGSAGAVPRSAGLELLEPDADASCGVSWSAVTPAPPSTLHKANPRLSTATTMATAPARAPVTTPYPSPIHGSAPPRGAALPGPDTGATIPASTTRAVRVLAQKLGYS
jgi:hypothetical protein